MPSREDIVAVARSYMNTPFLHQGRIPGHGLDCAGVVICDGWSTKMLPLEYNIIKYATFPSPKMVLREMNTMGIRVGGSLRNALLADILLMDSMGYAVHMGIVTQLEPYPLLLHCAKSIGGVREHVIDEEYQRSIRGVYRFRGLM